MESHKKTSRGRGGARIRFAFSGLLLAAAVLLWLNHQLVADWVSYRQYTPTSQMASFVERTAMTSTGKFYLYASQPSLEKTQSFNQHCDRKESSSAILGCYALNKIYIYDVADEKLDGVREVTAAHEMLHAVYQRLDGNEKRRIDELLDKEYQKHRNDIEFAERMEYYERTQPGEQGNELHSIIATEYDTVSAELETYYSKYFTDRSRVVTLHANYAAAFTTLKQTATSLGEQLERQAVAIEADSRQYNEAVQGLNDEIDRFNQRANSGSFTSRSAFNAERSALLARVEQLDAQRTAVDEQVKSYEALRQQYNDTVDESKKLYDSIDSRLAPAPKI